MAGGHLKYRHLSRTSAHRQALLRNLVTSLIEHESITTTWHKAKEAQRLAEKLISHGKKNTEASRLRAQQILFEPVRHLPKLFGELRARYLDRPGGYTRVLRVEPRNRNHDQAATAVLELVDGPRDMRFAMTARSLVRERELAATGGVEGRGRAGLREETGVRDITAYNIRKVTRFRQDGEGALLREVERLEREEETLKLEMERRKEETAKKRAEDLKQYEKERTTWDVRRGVERMGLREPKDQFEDDWDERDFEVKSEREGWEPYKLERFQKRLRRKYLDEKEHKRQKKMREQEEEGEDA